MSIPAAVLNQVREHRAEALEDLKALIRIPSVSTDPERKSAMLAAAEWIAGKLRAIGMDGVEILPTARHPVVYAESLKAGPSAPTVLYYGHYDVQPAEPLEEWKSPPFEPTQRGDNLYARGASDMKGQLLCFLRALEAWMKGAGGKLPLNLKIMAEGEEEIGSPSLPAFLKEQKKRLACDLCLNGDSSILGPETPSLLYGLRGLAYYELRFQGPASDLHSGSFGGVVHNPAIALCELIAGLHDAQGRVTLPGFYDRVRALEGKERESLARLPKTEAWWKAQTGAPELKGESGYTSTERAGARPTLDVNGLLSGFTGTGAKTVLPCRAMAKISMRLVPDQDPMEIQASLERYLKEKVPPTVRWELIPMSASRASILEQDSAGVRAASHALKEIWGQAPLFAREGGSVPVVGQIQDVLGVKSLMLGFGLQDDNLHAPNEKQHLPTFQRGIEAFALTLGYLGEELKK